MNKKPLSPYARAQAKAQGLTETEYRQKMSDNSKRANRDNAYFKKLAETDPEEFKRVASSGGAAGLGKTKK